MAADLKTQRAARTPGAFSHYATNGFDPPSDAMIALYNQFEESLGGASRTAGAPVKSRVHPYVASTMCGSGAATPAAAAVTAAVKKLLRCWHPETGIVLYRPKTVTTPPAANIRLMPVAEHIVEGLAPEAEQSQYWFWLSPRGAARVNTAVTAVEAAMLAAERQE
jgi:hypothetical protein